MAEKKLATTRPRSLGSVTITADGSRRVRKRPKKPMNGPQIVDRLMRNAHGNIPSDQTIKDTIRNKRVQRDALEYAAQLRKEREDV